MNYTLDDMCRDSRRSLDAYRLRQDLPLSVPHMHFRAILRAIVAPIFVIGILVVCMLNRTLTYRVSILLVPTVALFASHAPFL